MMLKLYDKNNKPEDIQKVINTLNDGGLIIYPTDTRYAIGCHAMKERAVEKICKIKDIDVQKNNLSIICYDLSNVSEFAKMNNSVFKLMKRNLPGPFTFILDGTNKLPKVFRNRKEIGVRMPNEPIIQEIAKVLNEPIMTTTIPYDPTDEIEYTTNPELINEKLGHLVDIVIDGGIGNVLESTIVNCTSPHHDFEIIRQGAGELIHY